MVCATSVSDHHHAFHKNILRGEGTCCHDDQNEKADHLGHVCMKGIESRQQMSTYMYSIQLLIDI